MFDLSAYSFKTDLSLAQLFARLNEVGPWTWLERDNENWGDYLSSLASRDPYRTMVKIYEEPTHFVVQMRFESEEADAASVFDTLRATLFERLLPAIGARDLTPTDTYD